VGSRARRPLLAVLAAMTAAIAVTGCVSMPNAGPVLSYPVTQETGAQNGQNMQVIVAGPAATWDPRQIVTGFLTAAAAFGNQPQVAKAYLTPAESKHWNPNWNAYVYQSGPNVRPAVYHPTGPKQGTKSGKAGPAGKAGKAVKQAPKTATVVVAGKIRTNLSGLVSGLGAVAQAPAPGSSPGPLTFQLVNIGGQWRISKAPNYLLLTQVEFADDYELRNLYFFDPDEKYLVPDPVYVPLQASPISLMKRLVPDLWKPDPDWLAGGATQTAFPPGTKITNLGVTNGLATVDLAGPINRAQSNLMSSQLLYTLVGSGQGSSQIESVELFVNGKPYYPIGYPQNPVQNLSQAKYTPPTGASPEFYYLDSAGDLYSRNVVTGKQVRIARIGVGYSQIAVSQDGQHLAALRNGALFIGPLGGPLVRQQGNQYATLSWDPADNLWATTSNSGQIYVVRTGASPNSRLSKPTLVTVTPSAGVSFTGGPFTDLQVAPDGVRVALIVDSDELTFGSIVWVPGTGPGLGSVKIVLSPFNVSNLTSVFNGVTWYGPDNVITLGGGSTLTDYPVNGGTSTSLTLDQFVESISAVGGPGAGQSLIAWVSNDQIYEAPTLTGAWEPMQTSDDVPVKGISPTYPG
jgi:Lipoprotein LpqB beta-propeller domain/Sporulation and spore germination